MLPLHFPIPPILPENQKENKTKSKNPNIDETSKTHKVINLKSIDCQLVHPEVNIAIENLTGY